jgi:maleylacetoacetate isomerase
MQLYTYVRSSAGWRMRIALELKSLPSEHIPVHPARVGGEQNLTEFRKTNPLGAVPVLQQDGGTALTRSLAIIEWLRETHPAAALLPADPVGRAKVRAFALAVACEIRPLNNLRSVAYLGEVLDQGQEARDGCYRLWIAEGVGALEAKLPQAGPGPFRFGDVASVADVCLVPPLIDALRCHRLPNEYFRLLRAEAAAMGLAAFRNTAPDRQADAA